eukprot:gene136-biopygen18053
MLIHLLWRGSARHDASQFPRHDTRQWTSRGAALSKCRQVGLGDIGAGVCQHQFSLGWRSPSEGEEGLVCAHKGFVLARRLVVKCCVGGGNLFQLAARNQRGTLENAVQ